MKNRKYPLQEMAPIEMHNNQFLTQDLNQMQLQFQVDWEFHLVVLKTNFLRKCLQQLLEDNQAKFLPDHKAESKHQNMVLVVPHNLLIMADYSKNQFQSHLECKRHLSKKQ